MSKNESQSVLMRYAAAGYLDWNAGPYSVIDRVSAGDRLALDAYMGGIRRSRVSDPSRIRVDGGSSGEQTVKCLYHLDLYNKAISVIPAEFIGVVRRVCVEDEPIKVSGKPLDVKRQLYAARVDLCRGLDRLVKYYKAKKIL